MKHRHIPTPPRTRRRKGDGGLYEERGGWMAEWKDTDGHRRRAYGATPEQALQRKATRINTTPAQTPRTTKPRKKNGPTVSITMDMWINERVKNHKIGMESARKYKANLNKYVMVFIGKRYIKNIKTSDIQRLFNDQNIAPSAYYHVWKTLKTLFTWTVKTHIIQKNPMENMDPPARTNARAAHIEAHINDHTTRLLTIARWTLTDDKMQSYRPFMIVLMVGLRREEALGLIHESINYQHGTITIRTRLKQVIGGGYRLIPATKNGHTRVVKIPYGWIRILDKQDKNSITMDIIDPITDVIIGHGTPVITRDDGTHWSYNEWNTQWKYIQRAYKKHIGDDTELTEDEYITPHETRHIIASLMSADKESILTAQSILGHLTPEMTEHYTHTITAAQSTAMDAIETAVMESGWITRAERVSGGMQESLTDDEYNDDVPRENPREIEPANVDSNDKKHDSWTTTRNDEKPRKTERQ